MNAEKTPTKNRGRGTVAGLIVAAGSSRRMGFDKVTAPLCGRPLLEWSLAAFESCPDISFSVLVCASDRVAEFEALAAPFKKVLHVVAGGSERAESVFNGLQAMESECPSFVAVHDAARPLIAPALISAVVSAAHSHGSAVAAEPVSDTLHRSDGRAALRETVLRKALWAMQTPQVAGFAELCSALESARLAGRQITDEISALIAAGHRPHAVSHGGLNFKVTFPRDLELAEVALGQRAGESLSELDEPCQSERS